MSLDARWTLGDALDFECALETAKEAQKDAVARDAAALREKFGPGSLQKVPRRVLFRQWVELRRKEGTCSLGAALDSAFVWARLAMWIAGGVLGTLSVVGYLQYSGKEPVNVFWFLFWLVAFPLLLTAIALIWGIKVRNWSGMGVLSHWLLGAICRRLPGDKKRAWEAWSGMLAKHNKLLAPLALPPLLGLTQRLACAFGIGALIGLYMCGFGNDIEFGWQSIRCSPEEWHRAARTLAMPWSWAFPSGCPTFEQVRDSQFTYVGGMAALDRAATRAWFPFLLGCLAVWSVGVRTILIAILGWKGRRALARLDFHHSDANALLRRLVGPLISSGGHPPSGTPQASSPHTPHSHAAGKWLALVADGVPTDADTLAVGISHCLRGTLSRIERIEIDHAEANTAVLTAIEASPDRVAVVVSAASDPIVGIKKTLQQVAVACARREWIVLLHGDPARLPLWQRFSDASRLNLDLVMWPSA